MKISFWKKTKKYRILSIDGGGLKGVFTLYALKRLEEDYDIKIIDHFDLIAGTSTGALIVASLLAGGSASELYDLYISEDNKIFKNKKTISQQLKSTFFAKYEEQALEDELEENFSKKTLKELYEETNKSFVVLSTNFTTAQPIIFSSPNLTGKYFKNDATVFEMLRSSTAAPMFFEPYKDEESGDLYLDGGLWGNNPGLTALHSVIKEYNLPLSNIKMLSFGQTYTNDLKFKILEKKMDVLKNPSKMSISLLLMSLIAISQNNQNESLKGLLNKNFYRYCPSDNQETSALDVITDEFIEYSKMYWEKNHHDILKFIKGK